MIQKILFCGDINGQFKKFIDKISILNEKHGPFEAVLTSGILFQIDGDNEEFEQLKNGTLKLPIPLIVLGPQMPEHAKFYGDLKFLNSGGEICPNLIYPGKCGIYRFANGGLSLAYLSSSLNEDGTCTIQNREFAQLKKLAERSSIFNGVDFFMTPNWPQGVTTYSVVPENYEKVQIKSSIHISHLVKILKPRYHLANSTLTNGLHYERAPYRNHANNALPEHVTRFVSLASIDNPTNAKWLYAIKITPLTFMPIAELVEQPPNTTESPYVALPSSSPNLNSKRLDPKNYQVGGPIKQPLRNKSHAPENDQGCWFCLSNPKCEKHLVIFVGLYNYVVLAKGGLVPHHLLIVPIEHYPNSQELPQFPKEMYNEITHLKKILINIFKRQGSGVLFYERNYASRHLQIQIVPVPSGNPDALMNTFIHHGKKLNIIFKDISSPEDSLRQSVMAKDRYFYVEFEDNHKLLHKIDGKFPLYFGRDVLASKEILSLPVYRIDWKKCLLSEQDEKTVVDELKQKFKLDNNNSIK